MNAFAVRGYAAAAQAQVDVIRQDWTVLGEAVTVWLARPVGVASAPLVVYLPGLGESGDAGAQWRMAWAGAGYAVLSVQPLVEDAQAWRSTLAREGEFKALGEQRYAGAAMRRRVTVLAAALDEARRRAIAGDTAWQGIAWDQRAVGGFDLGAYTAMALAGEQVQGADGLPAMVPVRAAVAISPFMDLAAGRLDSRYAAIFGPVLSVTSDVDGDPLGLVAGAAQRQAPFSRMPGPDKFLLVLSGLVHARLSGDGAAAAAEQDADESRTPSADAPSGGEGGTRGGRRRAPGDDRGVDASSPAARGFGIGDGAGLSPTAVRLRLTAAQQVSIAFLDAYVKDDPLAREWLARSAVPWLGSLGELRHK